jgi:NitT/TauT family transport system permease protein
VGNFEGKWPPRLAGAGFVAALLLGLQLLIDHGVIKAYLLPTPLAIVESFRTLVENENLVSRILATFARTFAAAGLATVSGILLGWALHRWLIMRRAYTSWVVALQAAPLMLLYPLFLVFLGRSASTIIAMSVVSALTPIVIKTTEGLGGTRRVLLDVGLSYNLTPSQQFWMIQFPSAVPSIFNGVRLGLIYALLSVVGVEYLIDFGGLGQLVSDLADRYEMPGMYGALIFVGLVSTCFFIVLERLETWLRPV